MKIHPTRVSSVLPGDASGHRAGLMPTTAPTYAMTPDQLEARMRALVAKYPGLVTMEDIGDSSTKHEATFGESQAPGHDIYALVLTDQAATGPKARLASLGAVHGSEMAAPTLLMEFAEQLLGGYGRDPQATMLLQQREIHLVPMVNPDGIEGMYRRWSGEEEVVPGRVNANHVNLNRNFPYGWGGLGSTSEKRSENYRGPSPASESETQAVMGYFTAHRPDVFIDWHNSGNLALYPWGETTDPGSSTRSSKDLAIRVASRNGFVAKPAVQLYPTTGTSIDWAHAAFGVPALTLETGSLDYLTDRGYEKIRRRNMPVLWDLADIASDPEHTAVGPDTWAARVHRGAVEAEVAQDRPDHQAITGAELLFDPTAAPGSGVAMAPVDGAFDSPDESVTVPMPAGSPTQGLAYVRSKDATGDWGALRALWLTDPVVPAPEDPSSVQAGEPARSAFARVAPSAT